MPSEPCPRARGYGSAPDSHEQARPKKSLGQHFLRDEGACRRIVELARIETGDQVLEIGPGRGALTRFLRPLPWSRLILVEKDDALAAEQAAHPLPGLEVTHGDALGFDWTALQGGWKIVGNLPYNVASPLMWDIVSRMPDLRRAVFMVQKEVADRILAAPGGRAYGALSAWMRSFVVPARAFNLGPKAFFPPPRVESAVVLLRPVPPDLRPRRPGHLARIIKLCFGQRRKQVLGIVRRSFPAWPAADILAEAGLKPEQRPETLTPQDFQRLADALFFRSEAYAEPNQR
ncbi:MAG: ribosomal RNA small subunit methyltransferase A [Desulfovibrionaceae bacterium]|nr:ribosomal RNA small subunit methyltransferase A [Desulfovibrionaceae bacterium]